MGETTPPGNTKSLLISQGGVFLTLAALILVLIACSYLIVRRWPSPATNSAPALVQPLQRPGGMQLTSLNVPPGYFVVYEQQQRISLLSTTSGVARTLETPGYIYNRAVTPIVTPAHELVYGGTGIWVTNLTSGRPRRLFSLPSGQVLTSLALSPDGTQMAWSSAPANGIGIVTISVGSLNEPARVVQLYQHPAGQCPCFRVFAFSGPGSLLLTNDQGDHRLVQYGLWRFDFSAGSNAQPRPLLSSDVQQGPLLFSPQTNALLYSSYEGFVPTPDSGVPSDITSLNYANSLLVASLNQAQSSLESPRVLLPEQGEVSDPAAERWATTPQISSDGRTLAYAEFSSGDRLPFARHYALYTAPLAGTSREGPQLLATASASYVELGPWLSDHILTFYADNALYALDMQHGALATLAQPGAYAHIVAVVK